MPFEPMTQIPTLNEQVNLKQSWEVNHWCDELNLCSAELIEIVKIVGTNLEAIRDFLARRSIMRESNY